MTVKVGDIAFVRFRAPDLDVVEAFLMEFGTQCSGRNESTLYIRGSSDEGSVGQSVGSLFPVVRRATT